MENAGARASVAGKIGGIVVVASNNAHKIEEIKTILGAVMPDAEFKAMGEVGGLPEPEETGTTFEENAFIKAETIHAATGLPTVADDSGLMVDALDAANNAKLLRELAGVGEGGRPARFVSCVAFVADGVRTCGVGFCEGRVGFEGRGEHGFGYDPLFLPDDTPGKTMAELLPEEKNAISHRRHAIEALADELRRIEG